MSSIAVKRDALLRYIDVLSQISTSQDSIIFFLLLQLKSPFYFDMNQLTRYRIHDSESNFVSHQNDLSRRRETALRFYKSRKITYDSMGSRQIKKAFISYVLESKFGCYFAGYEELKPTYIERAQLLVFGVSRASSYYLSLWMASFIYALFPKFVTNTRDRRERRRYSKLNGNGKGR